MREYFLDRIYGEYQAYKASVLEENGGSVYARSNHVYTYSRDTQELKIAA